MAQTLASGLSTGLSMMSGLFGGAGGAGIAVGQGGYTPAGAGPGGMIGHAEGGLAWTPHIAKIAENEPELITPLSRLDSVGLGGKGMAADIKELVRLNRKPRVVPVVIDRREDMASLLQRDYLRRGRLSRAMGM